MSRQSSAEKALKKSKYKSFINKRQKNVIKNLIKSTLKTAKTNINEATKIFTKVQSKIAKAASCGLLKKNNAIRKIKYVARQIRSIKDLSIECKRANTFSK